MVASLNQTTIEGLSFDQRCLSNNRPNQFHYIICLLPEFRWGGGKLLFSIVELQ